MQPHELDQWHMQRALELAQRGEGAVEPNPMVGCVVAQGAEIVGEGWHRRFGGPHAEVEALEVAGARARGSTLYVSLEPCCHFGKTPPCTQAILGAGVARVVAALEDPFPQVDGGGLAQLRAAGLQVECGTLRDAATRLNAPYLKLLRAGRPWVIAKWAMSLDGKLATATGESRWISQEASRRQVHQLRGRVDAILIGRGTALADNPLLTARPAGPRTALRVVADTHGSLPADSQLVQTARQVPLLVAVGPSASQAAVERLGKAGCQVWRGTSPDPQARLIELLDELGRRRLTNLLVEGGSQLLGGLCDAQQIDEVHVYIAPRIIGGRHAPSPIGGQGVAAIAQSLRIESPRWEELDGDLHFFGRVARNE